jgi:putative hemolysin
MSWPPDVDGSPFSVRPWIPAGPGARLLSAAIDRVLGLAVLRDLHRQGDWSNEAGFAADALRALDVTLDVTGAFAAVPPAGPLLVVSNHPFGCLDGLAVVAAMRRVRPDVKVLANRWLAAVPGMRSMLVGVELFGPAARAVNAAPLRAALAWLQGGGCLVVFPAGEVAHRVTPDGALSVDGAWHSHVGTLAARSGADVLPVLVPGANRARFRLAGRVHPLLRTALLPRELLARRGSRVRVVVGDPIAASVVARLPSEDRAAYLKARTYLLAPAVTSSRDATYAAPVPAHAVAPAQDATAVAADVAALPPDRLLAEAGHLRVYCAEASELPHVLPEIGRLRELTFRGVGEGTGRAADLDAFDAHYRHLFLWDAERARVAGAYRLAVTTDVLSARGAEGLYTRTLFRYDGRLLDEIGPALELGRSFVCEEYQRGFAPLLALWRGIGTFVARRPEIRRVFGAVSISSRYDSLSRQLLVRFLSTAARRHRASRLVEPMRPPTPAPGHAAVLETAAVTSLEGVASLLAAIEPDGKSVPVLVRQYLNLNARLLAFSVDPSFGDALDGLMLADLLEVPRPMLDRLMGREGAASFLEYHSAPRTAGRETSGRGMKRWWRTRGRVLVAPRIPELSR